MFNNHELVQIAGSCRVRAAVTPDPTGRELLNRAANAADDYRMDRSPANRFALTGRLLACDDYENVLAAQADLDDSDPWDHLTDDQIADAEADAVRRRVLNATSEPLDLTAYTETQKHNTLPEDWTSAGLRESPRDTFLRQTVLHLRDNGLDADTILSNPSGISIADQVATYKAAAASDGCGFCLEDADDDVEGNAEPVWLYETAGMPLPRTTNGISTPEEKVGFVLALHAPTINRDGLIVCTHCDGDFPCATVEVLLD